MAEQERKANKRFKILEDYEQRKQRLEDHAVQLLLKELNDPNLPMITGASTAKTRMACHGCHEPFWGIPHAQWYCPSCQEIEDAEAELNKQLHRIQREIRFAVAQEKLARITELRERGLPLSEFLTEEEPVDF